LKAVLEITPNLASFFGAREENLQLLEDSLGVHFDLRSDAVHIEGPQEGINRVQQIFADFEDLRRARFNLYWTELHRMLKLVLADPAMTLRSLVEMNERRPPGVRRPVQPRSNNQRKYIEAIEQNDLVFGIGPAGTGKTYLAVAMAIASITARKVSRIILARPTVEAGDRFGPLPGSLQEQIDPFMRPLYDALYDLLEPERVDKMLEKNIIEVAPLAFMRGRTLSDAFIILDDAQNTTVGQMTMFLTRLGFNSKAVITGDVTQIDLTDQQKSGLIHAVETHKGKEGIAFCDFEVADIVRHPLVGRILQPKPQDGETFGTLLEEPKISVS
jgi:phosphate starvation-inducible protein PhoH and related proteins